MTVVAFMLAIHSSSAVYTFSGYFAQKRIQNFLTAKAALPPIVAQQTALKLVQTDIDSLIQLKRKLSKQWNFLEKDMGLDRKISQRIVRALDNHKEEVESPSFGASFPGSIAQWVVMTLAALVGLMILRNSVQRRRKPSLVIQEDEIECDGVLVHRQHMVGAHAPPPLNDDRFVANVAVGSEPEPAELTPSFDNLLNKFDKGAHVRRSKVIILWSSLISNSSRMIDLFAAKKLSVLLIDGASPEDKEIRDELFSISGMRGKYPQCFLRRGSKGNRRYEFVGTWETVETLVESDSIPADFLAVHPEIMIFSNIFRSADRL